MEQRLPELFALFHRKKKYKIKFLEKWGEKFTFVFPNLTFPSQLFAVSDVDNDTFGRTVLIFYHRKLVKNLYLDL